MNEPPVVQQMILCEEARRQPDNPRKWDLIGLIHRFRSTKKQRPIRMPKVTVFLRLSNGRGEGEAQIVFVEDGRLALGRWQGIFFCEFDGPRERKLVVKVVAE